MTRTKRLTEIPASIALSNAYFEPTRTNKKKRKLMYEKIPVDIHGDLKHDASANNSRTPRPDVNHEATSFADQDQVLPHFDPLPVRSNVRMEMQFIDPHII